MRRFNFPCFGCFLSSNNEETNFLTFFVFSAIIYPVRNDITRQFLTGFASIIYINFCNCETMVFKFLE